MTKFAFDEAPTKTKLTAAGLLLRTPDGLVLFLRRTGSKKFNGSTWCIPGGKCERGETPVEAALRETREETAYIPPVDAPAPREVLRSKFYDTEYVTLEQRIGNPFVPDLSDGEHDGWAWTPMSAPPEPVHPGMAEALLELIKKIGGNAREIVGDKRDIEKRLSRLAERRGDKWQEDADSVAGAMEQESLRKNKKEYNRDPMDWGADLDDLPVDSDHDGPWLSCMAADGHCMYRNRNVPSVARLSDDETVHVDDVLKNHEGPEWADIQIRLAIFRDEHGGAEPDEDEKVAIYEAAHQSAGTPSEREYCRASDIDWDRWSAWCRGQEERVEAMTPENEPEDADVRPAPHRHGDLEVAGDAEFEESKHPRDEGGKFGSGAGLSRHVPKWSKNKKANAEEARKVADSLGFKTQQYANSKASGAAYFSNGTLSFNGAHKFWSDPVGAMKRQKELNHLSSDHPEHVIHHEIGHALYDPPDNFMANERDRAIAEKVSKYARMNPKEFVSEVHAGMQAGNQYPEDVMHLFNLYARKRAGARDEFTHDVDLFVEDDGIPAKLVTKIAGEDRVDSFEEGQHPRDPDGKFGSGPSSVNSEKKINGPRMVAAANEASNWIKNNGAAQKVLQTGKAAARKGLSVAIQSLLSHASGLDASTWKLNEDLVEHVVHDFETISGLGAAAARSALRDALGGLIKLRDGKTNAQARDEDGDAVLELLRRLRDELNEENPPVARDSEFEESKHPRAPDGKFGTGSGGAETPGEGELSSEPDKSESSPEPDKSESSPEPGKSESSSEHQTDKTHVWNDPKSLSKTLRAEKFGSAAKKLGKTAEKFSKLTERVNDTLSEVADITPEDRADLKEGYSFNDENDLEEALSDASDSMLDVRNEFAETVNKLASYLGWDQYDDFAAVDFEDPDPEEVDAFNSISESMENLAQEAQDAVDSFDEWMKENKGADEDETAERADELYSDLESAHESVAKYLDEMDAILNRTDDALKTKVEAAKKERAEWAAKTFSEREAHWEARQMASWRDFASRNGLESVPKVWRDRLAEEDSQGLREAQNKGNSPVTQDCALDTMALDQGSVRAYDDEGRLRVASTNISKANVCPYRGREIPGFEDLGLEPEKIYQLYRDPEELEKAAPSFRGVQILRQHVPVSADDHRPWDVVGAVLDTEFVDPYLKGELVFWTADAVADIESGDKRELSCGYRYHPSMIPGTTPDGVRFDGTMRDLIANHLAIVSDGRAGPDVLVQDSDDEELRWFRLERALNRMGDQDEQADLRAA